MKGRVLLSEAVCLVAEGLSGVGPEVAQKCRTENRLIGFTDGDVLYSTLRKSLISDTELALLIDSTKIIFDWLWSGKLRATYEIDGGSRFKQIGVSTWGHFTYNAVCWDLSAIRERRSREQIEGIKIDPRNVMRLLNEHSNTVLARAASGYGSKQGRPRTPGDDALIARVHRLLISGEALRQQQAVRQVVTLNTPGKSLKAAQERIRREHRRKHPNWATEAEAARLARKSAAVAEPNALVPSSRR